MWLERLKAALLGVDREWQPKVVADGARAGLWELGPAWEAMAQLREGQEAVPSAPANRRRELPTLRRLRLWEERPALPTGRFIRSRSLDATLDWSVSDGAARCLELLIASAGTAGRFWTLTSSLARQLGRHRNTAGNYLRQLAAAGWITALLDRRTGRTLIILSPELTPQPRPPERAPAAWPRMPEPKPWRRGGAQFRRHIKAETRSTPRPAPG